MRKVIGAAVLVIAMSELPAQTPTATQAAQRLVGVALHRRSAKSCCCLYGNACSDWNYIPRRRDGVACAISSAQTGGDHGFAALGAERKRPGQGARRDGAGDRFARARDVRLAARSRELRGRALRRAGCATTRPGAGASKAITCRCTGRCRVTATSPRCRSSSAPIPRACRATSARRARRQRGCLATRKTWPVRCCRRCRRSNAAARSSIPGPTATSSRATPSAPPHRSRKASTSRRCRRRSRRSCCR